MTGGLFDDLEPAPLELKSERIDRPKPGALSLFLILEPDDRTPAQRQRQSSLLLRDDQLTSKWRQVDEVLARNLMDAAGVTLEARGWRDAFWRHPRRGAIIGARGKQKFAVIDPRELKATELP